MWEVAGFYRSAQLDVEVEGFDDEIADWFVFFTQVLWAIEGDDDEFAILREEHHVIVVIPFGGIGSETNSTDIIVVNLIIIGIDDFAAKTENALHGVEIFFNLVVAKSVLGGLDHDVDFVVGAGINDVGSFAAVLVFDFFVAEDFVIFGNFETEFVVVQADVDGLDFVAFASFDGQ